MNVTNRDNSIEKAYSEASITAARNRKLPLRRSTQPSKVCAKFVSGTRFGVGIALERACGPDCPKGCQGDAFHRQCRFFDFRPHYDVKLEKKAQKPEIKVRTVLFKISKVLTRSTLEP